MDNIELVQQNKPEVPNPPLQVCSDKRYQDVKKGATTNYIPKNTKEPFVSGQKYYVLDKNVPNCVNSVVCNQTFADKDTSTYIDKDGNKRKTTYSEPTCFSYDAQYNTGTEIKQLDTLADNYANGVYDKFNTKISKRKYKYQLPTSTPDIYYRKCNLFNRCNSGTSLIDISGGRRKTRKNRRNYRKSRNRK